MRVAFTLGEFYNVISITSEQTKNMRNIFIAVKKYLLILLSITALTMSYGGIVQAASNATNDIQKYCKSHLPDKLEASVCTGKNINRITGALENKCKGKNQDSCVKQKAQDIIDKIAKKHPKNEKDFNDALEAALKDEAGAGDGGGDSCDGSE